MHCWINDKIPYLVGTYLYSCRGFHVQLPGVHWIWDMDNKDSFFQTFFYLPYLFTRHLFFFFFFFFYDCVLG